ncbi:MAG: DUF2975 domain-containing protein [Clostridia bacterium]|nr:DUF2975 domain-containing protein [Clostridia bacterium]
MYKNSVTHYIAKGAVDVLFYLGIAATVLVPWWSKFLRDALSYTNTEWYIMIGVLMLSGVCAVYILFVIKGMFKTLLGNNPFVMANVSAFRKVAVACAAVAVIYIVKCFLMFTVGTVVIAAIFVLGSLFCLTLKDIFKQAVCYKEENDLTV